METLPLGYSSWSRTLHAVELVKSRLARATATLERAGIAYAVVGGNAVAAWVGRVDESAVRFTQDLDLLIRRADLDATKRALEPIGFRYRHTARIDMFLDGPDAKASEAIRVIFAGERVRPEDDQPPPDVSEVEESETFKELRLDPLVRMKLTSFRDKDRTHLRDLIGVGLVDDAWPSRLPDPLGLTAAGDPRHAGRLTGRRSMGFVRAQNPDLDLPEIDPPPPRSPARSAPW